MYIYIFYVHKVYVYILCMIMYVCVFETIGKVMISQTHFKRPKLRILEK